MDSGLVLEPQRRLDVAAEISCVAFGLLTKLMCTSVVVMWVRRGPYLLICWQQIPKHGAGVASE